MSDSVDAVNVAIGGNTDGLASALMEGIKSITSFGGAIQIAEDLLEGPAGLVMGIQELVKFLGELDAAYVEDEKADLLFQTSLKNSKNNSDEFSASAEKAVKSIQLMTGASDDVAKQMVTTLSSTGRTAEEIDKMTTAAEGMANATGVSLDTALTQLNTTFSGTSGKLSRLNPELKDFSKTQLEGGAAVDVLYQKYKSFSGALQDSADVSIKNYKNAYDELMASMGKSVEGVVQPVRNAMTQLFRDLKAEQDAVNKSTDEYKQYLLALAGKATDYKQAIAGITTENERLEAEKQKLINLGVKETDNSFKQIAAEEKRNGVAALAVTLLQRKQDAAAKAAKADAEATAAQLTADANAEKARQDALDADIKSSKAATDAESKSWEKYFDDLKKLYGDDFTAAQLMNMAKTADAEKHNQALAAWAKSANDKNAAIDKQRSMDTAVALVKDMEHVRGMNQTTSEASAEYWKSFYDGLKSQAGDWSTTVKTLTDTALSELKQGFEELGKSIVDGGASWNDWAKAALQGLADVLESIGSQLAAQAVVHALALDFVGSAVALAGSVAAFVASGVISGYASKYATGTEYASGGMAIVGEDGPELVDLNRGAKVYNNSQTQNMMNNSKGGDTYNIWANNKTAADIMRESKKESRARARAMI